MSEDAKVQQLLSQAKQIEQNQKLADKPPEQPEKTAEEQSSTLCEVCGHAVGDPVIKPQEEDLKEFTRCILGNKLFAKTYTIGGELEVKLQLLSATASKKMQTLIDEAARRADEGEWSNLQSRDIIFQVKTLFYLQKWHDETIPQPADDITLDQLRETVDAFFEDKSEVTTSICYRTIMLFEQLAKSLTASVFDANFWKGAGLV